MHNKSMLSQKWGMALLVFMSVMLVSDLATRWYHWKPHYIRVEVPMRPEEMRVNNIEQGKDKPPQEMMDITIEIMAPGTTRWMDPNFSGMDLSQKVWLRPDASTRSEMELPKYSMKVTRNNSLDFDITAPLGHKWKAKDLRGISWYTDAWVVRRIDVWDPKNLQQ